MSLPKPSKIMYLLDAYVGPHAGTENQLRTLIEHIDKRKYMSYLTALRSTPYLEEQGFPCPVTVLNIHKIARPSTFWKLATYSRTLRREGFGVVHIFLNDASMVAPVFLKMNGIKVVVSLVIDQIDAAALDDIDRESRIGVHQVRLHG